LFQVMPKEAFCNAELPVNERCSCKNLLV